MKANNLYSGFMSIQTEIILTIKNSSMKIKELSLIITVLLFTVALSAQNMDCPSTLSLRKATPPFAFNDLSKSAQCVSGKKYEFLVPLMKGKDFRFTFFASPIFNNQINFRIIDMNTNEKVLDLPGESSNAVKGASVLREYFDENSKKLVHPYFDFAPNGSTTLKIIIEVLANDADAPATDQSSFKAPEEKKKGCITVFIQDKVSEDVGFN
jgi:hypothetical protein